MHHLLFQAWSLLYIGKVDYDCSVWKEDLATGADGAGGSQAQGGGDLEALMDIWDGQMGVHKDEDEAETEDAQKKHSASRDESEAMVKEAEACTAAALFATCSDDGDLVRRAVRVRAKKAGQWILQPRIMIPQLVVTLCALAPTERYLYHLLQGQERATWKGTHGLREVPLVQYSVLTSSPSAKALDEYAGIQSMPFLHACPQLQGGVRRALQLSFAMAMCLSKSAGLAYLTAARFRTRFNAQDLKIQDTRLEGRGKSSELFLYWPAGLHLRFHAEECY